MESGDENDIRSPQQVVAVELLTCWWVCRCGEQNPYLPFEPPQVRCRECAWPAIVVKAEFTNGVTVNVGPQMFGVVEMRSE